MAQYSRIVGARAALMGLQAKFDAAVSGRSMAEPSPGSIMEACTAARDLSGKRSKNIYAEIEEMLKIVRLSRERMILCRHHGKKIFGDFASEISSHISYDWNEAKENAATSANYLRAAYAFDPGKNIKRAQKVWQRILDEMKENINAQAPQTPVTDNSVRKHKRAYSRQTRGLLEANLNVVDRIIERVRISIDQINLIDTTLIPAFPTMTASFEQDAKTMIRETTESLARAHVYLEKATACDAQCNGHSPS